MMRGAIDPGREKFGWAFADNGTLLCSGIAPAETFENWCNIVARSDFAALSPWRLEGDPARLEPGLLLLLGNGTGSAAYAKALREKGLPHRLVEERGSTLDARTLYWRLHPPGGWRRFVPLSLQLPPRPIDDLAAWVLLLREEAQDVVKK